MKKLKPIKFNIDFMKAFKRCLIISGAVFLVGIIISCIFGVKLDIEYSGGAKLSYSFTGELDTKKAEKIAEDTLGLNVKTSVSSDYSGESKKLIFEIVGKDLVSEKATATEVKATATDTNATATDASNGKALSTEKMDALLAALQEKFEKNNIEQAEIKSVSASVGSEFFLKSLAAVLLASVLVVIYVAIRFRKIGGWVAGVAGLIALVHDVLFAFFICVIFRLSIDILFISVVLTLLGYSLNDTIVTFDRIRENRKKLGHEKPLSEIVNISGNQVITRNVATTVTTFAAIITVLIVAEINGITSLRTLTIPLCFGLISGAYSSLFIAPVIWVKWRDAIEKRKTNKKSK